MRYLSLDEVLELHGRVISETGGATGLRDLGAIEAAVALPRAALEGQELYPSVEEKAVTLGFALIRNHPFIDGNKRVGHAAMETFLVLNGWDLNCPVDEAERVILEVAAGTYSRERLLEWVRRSMAALGNQLPPQMH